MLLTGSEWKVMVRSWERIMSSNPIAVFLDQKLVLCLLWSVQMMGEGNVRHQTPTNLSIACGYTLYK